MTRLYTFVGRVCLAATIAIAALTSALAAAEGPSGEQEATGISSLDFNKEDATLSIEWSGPIFPGMADYLHTALDKYGAVSHRVILFLNSAGGRVDEGDRVIHVLDEAKQTHRLITVVPDGDLCASMCIPIFLQGDDRGLGRRPEITVKRTRIESMFLELHLKYFYLLACRASP